jgi:hypothetical protein
MEQLNCSICGALNFKTPSTLSSHKRSVACQSFASKDTIIKPNEFESSIRKRKLPSFEHEARHSIPNYESPKTSDVFLCTFNELVQVESHYDSSFSLVHWIRHCKAIIGLSNKNTSKWLRS